MSHNTIDLLGYASDVAGANRGSGEGAPVLKNSPYLQQLNAIMAWDTMIKPDITLPSKVRIVEKMCQELSLSVAHCILEKKFFAVLGGDHTAAIGTWSGVCHVKRAEGPIGLIWVDAHLDSHTPQTSESSNLHGMPLACLLGYGEPLLTTLLHPTPKIQPANVCLIGVRSYEQGELELLKKLNVRIYFMDEVKQKGISRVVTEAVQHVSENTCCYGITIDIDGIDPIDAPGTGVAEPGGIPGESLCQALTQLADDPRLVGAEIVEFDPRRDKDHMTEKLITRMLNAVCLGKTS